MIVVRSRRVVTPTGVIAADVSVVGDRIDGVHALRSQTDGVIDVGDDAVLPGLVDTHVHFNEPGRDDWEGIATGTAGALAGGVTTVVDMPLNSSPVTTTVAALEEKQRIAERQSAVRLFCHAGVVPNAVATLGDVLDAGALAAKAFLCDSGIDEFPAARREDLIAAMGVLRSRNKPLLVHAELTSPVDSTPSQSYADYAASRPPEFERRAVSMMVDLCRQTGCHTHIVHVADAGAGDLIAAAKAEGLPMTAETCPHYLTFESSEIPDGGTAWKCAPPIRDAANREALWDLLRDGTLDMVATDHSPCPPAMKDRPLFEAWGGVASLQWSLPVVWTEASRRGFDLSDVCRWMASGPASLIGLRSAVEGGAPADLVVFDAEAEWTADVAHWRHRHAISPYDGMSMRGDVRRVMIAGQWRMP